MSDLMRDDVGFRKSARARVRAGAEFALHILEESGVEIYALIARAVKRAHGRAGESARGRLGTREQAQFRRVIGPAAGGKDLAPAVLGVAQHQRDERAGGIVCRAGCDRWRWTGLLGRRTEAVEQVEDYVRIHAKIPAYQADDDDGSDAETAPTSRHPARCARLAIVFDIAAGTEIIGAHLSFPNRVPLELKGGSALSNSPRSKERLLLSNKNDHVHSPAARRTREIRHTMKTGSGEAIGALFS